MLKLFTHTPAASHQLARASVAASLLCLLVLGCQSGEGAKAKTSRDLVFPVQTAPVRGEVVQYGLDAVGSIEAFERIR